MILKIDELHKRYNSFIKKNKLILNGVSFSIISGQIYSLIGQNGVGKTTTIKCILNLVNITKGSVTVDNKNIIEIMKLSQVGYLPENLQFTNAISLYSYLLDLCIIKGMDKKVANKEIHRLVELFDLGEYLDNKINKLSKGMKKKIGLIQAVINKPNILILDEPTDGLDPISRRKVLRYIRKLADDGAIILITSHILSDLCMISDRIGLIDSGMIISEVDTKDLVSTSSITLNLYKDNNDEKKIVTYDMICDSKININNYDFLFIENNSLQKNTLEEWYYNALLERGTISAKNN